MFDRIHDVIEYQDSTGKLFWKNRPIDTFVDSQIQSKEQIAKRWNAKFAGKEAFNRTLPSGHKAGFIFKTFQTAHRIIWFMHFGYWPNHVDHIDGNPQNNLIENLRDVDHSTNMRNKARYRNNSSGFTGVHMKRGKWVAVATINKKRFYLGEFPTIEQAFSARSEFIKSKGFTSRHGN